MYIHTLESSPTGPPCSYLDGEIAHTPPILFALADNTDLVLTTLAIVGLSEVLLPADSQLYHYARSGVSL